MSQFRNLDEFVAHLRSQGVRVDVVGHDGSRPTVVRCGCPRCRDEAERRECSCAQRHDGPCESSRAETEVDEGEMQASDSEGCDSEGCADEIQPYEALNPLVDIANALDVGVEMTITLKRHFQVTSRDDEEAGE